MTYLFLGNNTTLKTRKINEVKSQYLKSNDARHFDLEALYADKLDKDVLKKALLDLPAIAPKRVVIIHAIEKLKKDHQRIIEEFLKDKKSSTVLILDSDAADVKNAFIDQLKRAAEFTLCDAGAKKNVFDMTRDMQRRDNVNALKTLFDLIAEGEQPVRILGALVWFWGRMKEKVSRQRFHQGLQFLQEADLNIKRSRLDPAYSLEKLVISLTALLG